MLSLPLLLLCVIPRSRAALKNDATEILGPHVVGPAAEPPANVSLNRARTGGRGSFGAAHDGGERGQVGCRELRSTKYISDGQCTSINPIKELVCAGECLPAQLLPNWIGGSGGAAYGRKFWSRRNSPDWRCVNDKTRTQRIQLRCQDGGTRTYKITVVTSCKCKRYSRQHNDSGHKVDSGAAPRLLQPHKSKAKRKHGKSKLKENWPEAGP
ncbi:sclerostin domain-containing protein 1a [Denticeps clupeoides]|uniref:Sclerostin domain-containing protein 1 n=1 Tax=Denticeps clupeoides TaxID=299321 RepID=A0AAY4EMT9_9TELE|nr:sclerostin domain-containing protein 1 [Denticeps clupeoides]